MFCEHLEKRVMIIWNQNGLPKDKSWETHHMCEIIWVKQCLDFSKAFDKVPMTFLPSSSLGATRKATGAHGDSSGVAQNHLLQRRQSSCKRGAEPLVPPPTWMRGTLLLSVFIILKWILFKQSFIAKKHIGNYYFRWQDADTRVMRHKVIFIH